MAPGDPIIVDTPVCPGIQSFVVMRARLTMRFFFSGWESPFHSSVVSRLPWSGNLDPTSLSP